ncbi:19300_t:CDS:2 [Rhizophagus irregularis]|nr:19300_t:CDS:2 [Rhizophagus irregularis]
MNEIRPLYPPLITPELLMPKPSSSNSSRKLSSGINYKRKKESNVKFPNAFIAYRMEFCRQLKNKRMCLTMQDVSYFASRLWKKEPCDVKKTYTQLANDAKLLYEKQMNSTYNIPATDPCNLVLFNNFLPPFEDFNIQPSIVPQNYFSPETYLKYET